MGVTPMSRGLSQLQQAVLKELDQRPLNFFDIANIHWKRSMNDRSDAEALAALREGLLERVDIHRNYSAIYRMMRSLVRRGLVGQILGVRPRLWVKVHYDKDTNAHDIMTPGGMRLAMLRMLQNELRLRVGNQLYTLKGAEG